MSTAETREKILRVCTYEELQTLIHEEASRVLDDARCEFMSTVYSVLSEDSTNDRANEIINKFDTLLWK